MYNCVLAVKLFRNSRRSYRFPRDRLPAAARPFFFFTPPFFKRALFRPPVQYVEPALQEYPLSAVRFAVVLLENVFAVECVTLDLVLSMKRDMV